MLPAKSCSSISDASNDLTRRTFLRTAAASVGALAAAGMPIPAVAARGTATRYPLHIPPAAYPDIPLSAIPATVDLGDGRNSSVLGYYSSALVDNRYFPGPTFRANSGNSVNVPFTNGLTQETTIHWHGMIVPTVADGHPKDAVAPGGSYPYYQYSIKQRACLNWYHPHPHMITGKQVCLGLAGAFIVNDAEEGALHLPSGAHEVPLIIRDASLDSGGNLTYNAKTSGFLGKIPLVNGTHDPFLEVDTALYRFRVLNGANARLFKLALSNGAPFTVIGNDGGLLQAAVRVTPIEFGPAERLDLIVDFRGLPVGTTIMLQDLNASWDLLQFVVTRQVSDTTVIPTVLSTITPLSNPARTRIFSFDGMSRINGKVYNLNRIDFQVPFGETERWRFTTNGNAPHPVHVHGTSFQVQSRTGGRGTLFSWERGWKDTVLLEDGETVDVLLRFDGYRGEYLLHCHKLEHEDMGMMSNFVVA